MASGKPGAVQDGTLDRGVTRQAETFTDRQPDRIEPGRRLPPLVGLVNLPKLVERVELGETFIELTPLTHPQRHLMPENMAQMAEWRREWCHDNGTLNPPPGSRFLVPPERPPSARAALVLSAVGRGWEGRQW